MAQARIGGLLEITANGTRILVKGSWTYGLGGEKNEAIVGPDRVHGYKSAPQVPYLEGGMSWEKDLDLPAIMALDNATIVARLNNGKTVILRDAWWAGENTGTTEEQEIAARFEGISAEID